MTAHTERVRRRTNATVDATVDAAVDAKVHRRIDHVSAICLSRRAAALVDRTLVVCLLLGCGGNALAQARQPPGQEKSAETRALELGSNLLQRKPPLAPMDLYLVGFHPMKEHPDHQMEAHHFCHQVNEDFAQCVLFDGNGRDANLTGIEYIVSERLFETLPEPERMYWHPHNAEILSGQLVAPGIPAAAEKALMKGKMNSYGKTWHVWDTGAMGQPGDKLPLGAPRLAWSFNRDGEVRPGLLAQRDRRMGIDTAAKRRQRVDLVPLARPQFGVDELRGVFPAARPMAGVVEKGARSRPAPPQH